MLSLFEDCHSFPVGGHTVVSRLCIRFFNVGIIGQPFINILKSLPNHAICANYMEEFEEARTPVKSYSGD